MSQPNSPQRLIAARRSRGFTMVELMVALLIGLFLIGGLLGLVVGMKRTTGNQGGMSQLQDNQRVAMNLITDVVQSAGFFNDPVHNTLTGSFPGITVSGQTLSAGQSVSGTGSATAAAPGDTITIRYNTTGSDKVINCLGGTSATAVTFVNTFSLVADTVNGNYDLQCTLIVMTGSTTTSTTTSTLVTGVTNLQILYGVQTNAGSGNSSADTYLDATGMSTYWGNVISVQVTLSFANPFAGTPGQTTRPTIPFTRVIGVMNKTGVNT
jgi:type IV pilus assembly protein PilW